MIRQTELTSHQDKCPTILQEQLGKSQPQEPYRTTDGRPRRTLSTTERGEA